MKQLVILSGKGGTGKTSVVAAFAHLAKLDDSSGRIVLADADVDAANLELVFSPRIIERHEFFAGSVALIDSQICQGCGECERVCRFSAIVSPKPPATTYRVDPFSCEGCASCLYACPSHAIHMETQVAGIWFHSSSRFGDLVHAQLEPGKENSGKLVSLVKQHARLLALDTGADLVIVDGPPGIGCPVISAASGADLALLVAEPTLSGIHDMERVYQTARHFRLQTWLVINKADLCEQGAAQLRKFCGEHQVRIAGEIPYDEKITQAMVQGEPVTAYAPQSPASQALIKIWGEVRRRLLGGDELE